MAEQTILSVSLNEYKNQIKDIQASMLGLERTSEEYQKAAQKAAEMQNKLNTVLGDSRKGSDYAADSINALTVKYRDLHNELMKMSPNDAKFKEMAAEAKKLGDEINARKQDMGDFTSNIGHYSEGIISAFNTMGVSIKGLGPAFNLATAGTVGFKGALTTLSAHPIMAVLVGFAALLMKVKSAISENAELSEKWKVAMASFEPIINAVKNALDWLATGLVNLVSFVTSNIPTVLRTVGNGAKTVFNIVGKIVDVIMFIPTKVAEVNVAIAKLVTAGLEKVAGGLADFLDTIGIDGFAQKLRNAGSSVANAAAKVGDGIIKGMKGAGDAVSSAGSVIDGWMNKAANAVTTTQNLQREQNKLAADNRAMLEKEANFEKTQADLRFVISKLQSKLRLWAVS